MKALVLASGGVDSTTCLGLAVNKYGKENVIALTVAYGQKHTKRNRGCQKKQQNITEWNIFIWIWSRSSGTVTVRFWSIQTERSHTKAMQSS